MMIMIIMIKLKLTVVQALKLERFNWGDLILLHVSYQIPKIVHRSW